MNASCVAREGGKAGRQFPNPRINVFRQDFGNHVGNHRYSDFFRRDLRDRGHAETVVGAIDEFPLGPFLNRFKYRYE